MSIVDCVAEPAHGEDTTLTGVVVGTLVGLAEEGSKPLVIFPGQPGLAGIAARTVVPLAGHIGRQVVLMFDGGDPLAPIVMGCIQHAAGTECSLDAASNHVDVDVDGGRLLVSAQYQLVLRCGKASITLTRTGKILLEGTYICSKSTGANRIKGGSVQLN